tara:strand:+ start:438 stop:539 length:102 start_codon:yes stop_codon:yes gene_type:complete
MIHNGLNIPIHPMKGMLIKANPSQDLGNRSAEK